MPQAPSRGAVGAFLLQARGVAPVAECPSARAIKCAKCPEPAFQRSEARASRMHPQHSNLGVLRWPRDVPAPGSAQGGSRIVAMR